MKKKKIIPFAFLGLLFLIIIFITGVKYGRTVAETDKAIHFIVSMTPTKAITQAPPPSITYKSYRHKECGVEFLLPSNLETVKESSTGGLFKNKTSDTFQFDCAVKNPLVDNIKDASPETIFIDQKNTTATKSGSLHIFTLLTKKRTSIQFAVSDNVLSLIQKTLKITK
jgi:hypothetical protein